jgi:hypothetical protein
VRGSLPGGAKTPRVGPSTSPLSSNAGDPNGWWPSPGPRTAVCEGNGEHIPNSGSILGESDLSYSTKSRVADRRIETLPDIVADLVGLDAHEPVDALAELLTALGPGLVDDDAIRALPAPAGVPLDGDAGPSRLTFARSAPRYGLGRCGTGPIGERGWHWAHASVVGVHDGVSLAATDHPTVHRGGEHEGHHQ